MEEFIKVEGKTVEDALMEASIQLGTSSDNIEYRVIERETKGFLGIGAKKAKIEARKKVAEEDIIGEIFNPKKTADTASEKKAEKKAKPAKEQVKAEKPVKESEKKAKEPEKKAAKSVKEQVKPVNEPEKKAAKPAAKPQKPAVENEEKTGEAASKIPADPQEAKKRAEEFLTSMIAAMGTTAIVTTSFEDNVLSVNLDGDDMGVLIGKRGQTLDSIQYLTSLVVNRGKASYVRVKVDTENYRERRKATLENLAKNMAFKVKKTRRPAYLEPMNPYERRIIHSALQNDTYVTTHSEGEEPCRKVVITLKKRERGLQDMTDGFSSEE